MVRIQVVVAALLVRVLKMSYTFRLKQSRLEISERNQWKPILRVYHLEQRLTMLMSFTKAPDFKAQFCKVLPVRPS